MTHAAATCSLLLLGSVAAAACPAPPVGMQTPAPSHETSALRQPRELGAVQWQRRFEPALDEAKRSNKPLLLLFQEVPG